MKRQLSIIVTFALMLFSVLSLSAQPGKVVVSGTVKSDSGEPLVGASVLVKGSTTRGTIVNADGTYQISASEGETLIYDCLGFVSQ